jgi:hypothetical protein
VFFWFVRPLDFECLRHSGRLPPSFELNSLPSPPLAQAEAGDTAREADGVPQRARPRTRKQSQGDALPQPGARSPRGPYRGFVVVWSKSRRSHSGSTARFSTDSRRDAAPRLRSVPGRREPLQTIRLYLVPALQPSNLNAPMRVAQLKLPVVT